MLEYWQAPVGSCPWLLDWLSHIFPTPWLLGSRFKQQTNKLNTRRRTLFGVWFVTNIISGRDASSFSFGPGDDLNEKQIIFLGQKRNVELKRNPKIRSKNQGPGYIQHAYIWPVFIERFWCSDFFTRVTQHWQRNVKVLQLLIINNLNQSEPIIVS